MNILICVVFIILLFLYNSLVISSRLSREEEKDEYIKLLNDKDHDF